MSDQDVNSLIGSLTEELEPVKPLPHPLLRMVPLVVVSFLYLAIMIAMLGPREDWMIMTFNNFTYVFEFALSFSIFVSAAFALGWLSYPDMRGQTWVKAVPVTLGGVFVLWAILRIIFEWDKGFVFSFGNCSLDGFVMIALPVLALTYFSKMGATTQPGWSSAMVILSFCGLGWGGLRFTCGADSLLQSLVIHFIPFVLLGIAFGFLARRIFRW